MPSVTCPGASSIVWYQPISDARSRACMARTLIVVGQCARQLVGGHEPLGRRRGGRRRPPAATQEKERALDQGIAQDRDTEACRYRNQRERQKTGPAVALDQPDYRQVPEVQAVGGHTERRKRTEV